ncbi:MULTISPECIES: hypothetical protein [unclassified Bartonella]|uniref:hypothetical protein n=1 Tax=unclassified Bartonella TaxID=2645622 RepID=UPI00235E14AB|nr:MULTISPECIES: hypothetical protein [unclassified Bartonella]
MRYWVYGDIGFMGWLIEGLLKGGSLLVVVFAGDREHKGEIKLRGGCRNGSVISVINDE